MSRVKEWWELADGSLTHTLPKKWMYRYDKVNSIDGTVTYWYIEPYATRIVTPINPQDLPKEIELYRFLLGDD